MTEFARFFIEMGSRVTTGDYVRAEGRIAELKATFDDAFETYDLIMSPVSCFPAFPNETFPGSITGSSSYPVQYWNGAFTMHANAIGHPAASVPAGFSKDGLPIGLQIIGRKYDEGDGARRVSGVRARPAVDRAQAAGFVGRRSSVTRCYAVPHKGDPCITVIPAQAGI